MVRFNASPPSDMAWMVGKTAASALFVREAEVFLKSEHNLSLADVVRLQKRISAVKKGEVVLTEFQTIEDYLLPNTKS